MAHGPGAAEVRHQRDHRFGQHEPATHTEHVLSYLVRGRIRMEHGGEVEARAGMFLVIPAGVPHRSISGDGVDWWMVGFCASCLALDEGQPLMAPFRAVRGGALPVLEVPRSRRAHVVRLFRALAEESKRSVSESPELVGSLVRLLLGELRRAAPHGPLEGVSATWIGEALEVIQRRCLEPISLRDVAAAVHRTPAHVASRVKQATGYSVGEWITAGRVAEAAIRLVHTDEPLDVIAEQVGWSDKTHFIRQFKKAHGVTPAAFRRAQRAV